MTEYLIRNTDGTFSHREPTVGRWYCGMTFDQNYADNKVGYTGPNGIIGYRDDAIAECIEAHNTYGYSTFIDENDNEVDFALVDWIAEQ